MVSRKSGVPLVVILGKSRVQKGVQGQTPNFLPLIFPGCAIPFHGYGLYMAGYQETSAGKDEIV